MAGTVVFTGPNGGMTSITVRQYAQQHPEDHLILLVRNPIKLPSGAVPASERVAYEAFDMTSIADVRAASARIAAKVIAQEIPHIKAIVCSAAIQVTSPDQPRITKDGYEETVAVNHLAHFALILDLLPHMTRDGQIIIVGSDAHRSDYKFMTKKALYRPLKELVEVKAGGEPAGEARDNGMQRYATSKLMQMMIGHELSRRLHHHPTYAHLRVVMFDPGSMGGTSLFRDQSFLARTILSYVLRFPSIINWLAPGIQASLKEDSAATLLRIIEDREYAEAEPIGAAKQDGGAPYYDPWGKQIETHGEANQPEKGYELWTESAALLGIDGSLGENDDEDSQSEESQIDSTRMSG